MQFVTRLVPWLSFEKWTLAVYGFWNGLVILSLQLPIFFFVFLKNNPTVYIYN